MTWKHQKNTAAGPMESGAIRKDWGGRIRVALIYPNRYHTGMANLGFQQVYRILNSADTFLCERAFLPEPGRPLLSVESRRRLTDFDILAFSLSFENDYLNVLSILDAAGIPFAASARAGHHPLVIAGGVACMLNPEPVAPFFDCIIIGEAEAALPAFMTSYSPETDRYRMLRSMAEKNPGIYVPSLYSVSYNSDGTLSKIQPERGVPESISRAYVRDLSNDAACSTILSDASALKHKYLIEVSRGCPHGCRFCGAGFVYRPPRFSPRDLLTRCLEKSTERKARVGLVGAAVSDLPEIDALCRAARTRDIQLSFSSLRADRLTGGLISALGAGGVKTATIAPDAGSHRMRTVINKGISETAVLNAARRLVNGGIPNLKLYFMLGLPTETEADVKAIVSLCLRVKDVFLEASRPIGRIGGITVSLSPFVPKPSTPFQWAAMDSIAVLKKKIRMVRKGLKAVANIRVHADRPQQAYVQALLSRGDRRVSTVLVAAHDNAGNWSKTLKSCDLNTDFYVLRRRRETEQFPWDFIDHKVDKTFLWREYRRALEGKPSPPCPLEGGCSRCGVCGDGSE